MNCKSLENLSRHVDSLYAQFTSKTRRTGHTSSNPLARAQSLDDSRYVFLKGELLMFSEMTRSEVVTALQNIGLGPSVVTIITEGDPLYFADGPTSDTYKPFDYFLRQADLPYGFAGPDGTFQFSSPELTSLRKSSAPVFIDDAYIYGGSDGATIPYENVSNPYNAFQSHVLGWTKSVHKQTAQQEVERGEFPHVTLRDNYGILDRRNLGTREGILEQMSSLSGPYLKPETGFLGSIGNSYYNPGKYIGWRMAAPGNHTINFSTTVNLLTMPEGQLAEFEVNPSNQQPYRGAEGVYPVILVELNEDVNLRF
ncbi:Hypothetical protein GSB_154709 [Giardia duodenalis]|uniref:Uncharacterized protein n=1 Tax=Giardia intestinalis TaxID=5741 RepID=V6TPX6_GIAIN|nr:Hypothetical protein GSB_154709 [Giardia intestinalis]